MSVSHPEPGLAPTPTSGPMQDYRSRLEAGTLSYDPAQEQAVMVLDRLHQTLRVLGPARVPGQGAGGFLRFFSSGRAAPQEPVRGVYLCGDVGRGKSMLMDLFYDNATLEPKRRVHFHAFMQEIHGSIREWRGLDEAEQRKRLRSLDLPVASGADPIPPVARQVARDARLLCFDELQVTDVADAMILGRLFEALFADGVVMVSTSNRAPGGLYADGINRQLFLPFIALIQKRMEVHHLDGETDYRLQRIMGRPVYHVPLGPVATGAVDQAWADLTDDARPVPCAIEVHGRRLAIPQAARGVARFTFMDLCVKPLGPADYLAIAKRFHTVLVDDIPKMGPEKRNEAKRFVTLIDALYEAKVNLIASAQAPPVGLYPAGDGSFEFARTASRLMEMQSADYIEARHIHRAPGP